jgi:hypothetical protein
MPPVDHAAVLNRAARTASRRTSAVAAAAFYAVGRPPDRRDGERQHARDLTIVQRMFLRTYRIT